MKLSTKRSSSKSVANVRGMLFYRKGCTPIFITTDAWYAKGCPPNCFVYDGAHQLLSAGIPIQDAVEIEGRWVRAPMPASCAATVVGPFTSGGKKLVRASAVPLITSRFITALDSTSRKLR